MRDNNTNGDVAGEFMRTPRYLMAHSYQMWALPITYNVEPFSENEEN